MSLPLSFTTSPHHIRHQFGDWLEPQHWSLRPLCRPNWPVLLLALWQARPLGLMVSSTGQEWGCKVLGKMGCQMVQEVNKYLVGGINPFETYWVKNGSCPQFSAKQWKIKWNHQLEYVWVLFFWIPSLRLFLVSLRFVFLAFRCKCLGQNLGNLHPKRERMDHMQGRRGKTTNIKKLLLRGKQESALFCFKGPFVGQLCFLTLHAAWLQPQPWRSLRKYIMFLDHVGSECRAHPHWITSTCCMLVTNYIKQQKPPCGFQEKPPWIPRKIHYASILPTK